jgi:DNA-binding NarL/FixJ family response regulator
VTPRELAVLHLLVEGLSDKEIAEELEISRLTVSRHVERILAASSTCPLAPQR